MNRLPSARELGGQLLDLLFPPQCLVCDRLSPPFCEACRAGVKGITEGGLLPEGIDDARCLGLHEGPLRRAVIRLKFEHKTALARPLGELLGRELLEVMGEWQPDAIVPVPIHWTRDWERGFNQSELLAEAAGRQALLPVWRALRRTRRTRPQLGLSSEERASNLSGAFAVDRRVKLKASVLVLVDDVRTTGATLAECARTLREAGAERVLALTVSLDL